MSVVYACIAPHGGNLLLEPDAPGAVPLSRRAMQQMRRSLAAAQPDSILILTPHGMGVEGYISLGIARTGFGEIEQQQIRVEIDLELADELIFQAGRNGLPIAPLTSKDPNSDFPLDWGVTIPLSLLVPPSDPLPTLVACPARDVSRADLVNFGEILVEASESLERRVALIVSADQGHGHAADGPYGYTPASAEYDAAMQAAIEADDLPRLLGWSEDYAETALADSYWQTLTLIGVQKHIPLRARFLAYEVDHYFGLLCAEFTVD